METVPTSCTSLSMQLSQDTARGVHGQSPPGNVVKQPLMEINAANGGPVSCNNMPHKGCGLRVRMCYVASLLIACIYLIALLTTSLSPVNRMPFRSWSSLFILGLVYQSNRVVLPVRSIRQSVRYTWAQSFAESIVASSPVGTSVFSDSPSFASCFSASLICSRVCSLSCSSFT